MRRGIGVLTVVASVSLAIACTAPEPAQCPEFIGYDIEYVYIDATNATIRGGNTGSNYPCPQGGSATVTRTGSGSGSALDAVVTFHQCKVMQNQIDLLFDGVLHSHEVDYSSGGGTYCSTCTFTSDALTLRGTEIGCNADPIDATCAVSFTVMNESSTSRGDYAGSICTLTFP